MTEANKNKIISWLKKKKRLLIGIGTIVLIIFMFLFVDFFSLILKIATIGLWGLLLLVATYTIAFILRAYKLKLVFKGLNQDINYSTAFFSIGICFIINDLTPGKVGDIAKIFVIKDQENVKLSESVSGIAVERMLDLILLFCISCCALIYLYFNNLSETGITTILGQNIQIYLAMGAILILSVLIFLIILIYKTELILNVVRKISIKLAELLSRFLINFNESIKKFKDNKKTFIYIVLLGFPTWCIDALIVVIFFYLLGYQLNVILLVLAIILSFFSKTIPITPGGWGISENVGALFIFLFYPEIPFVEILSIFIIDHLFRSFYIFFYGGYSIFHYNFNLKEMEKLENINN